MDVPLGHIEMVEPPDKTLQDKTDEILSKESSTDNIAEVKEEPVNNITQLSAELMDVTSSGGPPDATRNLIVALPPDMQPNLNTDTQTLPTVPNPKTTPCSVKLIRCDIPTTTPTLKRTESHIEVNVVVNNPSYDLRPKNIICGNKATSTTRSRRATNQNISYVDLFHESSSEDTASESTVQPIGAATKREPSHYRLAAHKYMLARKRGIISGPRVRTRASVVSKKEEPDPVDSDSDATLILGNDNRSPVTAKNKTRGRNKKPNKRRKQKTFVTKTYVLRKGGLPGKAKNK